jgi:hypothetical protein
VDWTSALHWKRNADLVLRLDAIALTSFTRDRLQTNWIPRSLARCAEAAPTRMLGYRRTWVSPMIFAPAIARDILNLIVDY